MFILHLLRNSHLRTMTFCFIYFSFIFGISCKDLTTQKSYSLTTTSTRTSTIVPSWTTHLSHLLICLNCYIRQLLQRGHRLTLFIDPGDQPHCSEFGKSEFPRMILPIPRYPFPLN